MTRLRYNMSGFLSDAYYYYDSPLKRKGLYLTDVQQSLAWGINPIDKRDILNDKIAFDQHFSQYIPTPQTLATVKQGQIAPVNNHISNLDDLHTYLIDNGAVVMKAQSGAGGYGILVIKYKDKCFYLNDKIIEFTHIKDLIAELDNYFISEYLIQSDFSKELFPKTVNTIRILTMIDPKTKEPFIPVAVQRVGTEHSIPTDNWQQGAMSVKVNLDTGALENAIYFPQDGKAQSKSHHPDTGQPLTGKVIPNWPTIKEVILKAASENDFLHYIGWDVVVTEDGIKVLEANNGSGVIIYQVHEPLLKDERVRAFYKYHNII